MKSLPFYSLLMLCCLLGTVLSAQEGLKPTKTEALVAFTFTNPLNKKPVPNKIFTIVAQTTKEEFRLKTNKKGEATVLVPVAQDYAVDLPNWKNFATFSIPKGKYQRHAIPVPFYEIPKDGSDIIIEIPVKIQLVKENGLPSMLEEELIIRSGRTKRQHHVKTNKQGVAEIKLPINSQYVLSLEGAPHYYKFDIPNKPYAAWNESVWFERKEGISKYPSLRKALFNFVFKDMDEKTCAGEKFWLQSLTDNKKYEAITNEQGLAQILVPLNDTYSLNALGNLNFGRKEVALEAGKDIIIETIMYQSPSTIQRKARKNAQNIAAALRDSIAKNRTAALIAKLDSIEKAHDQSEIELLAKNDMPIPIKKKTFRIKKAVFAKVEIYEKQLRVNPNFFEDKEKPILAVLERLNKKYDTRVVVTDVTQSMDPYLEEVLIWHVLHLRQGNQTRYFFFNDGNKKMASDKKIGCTGGIYDCAGVYEQLPVVIQTMQNAMQTGLGGGEPPENDLEAVLKATQSQENVNEVILIADSYSRIRDMELLSKISVPVRVILCGAAEKNDYYKGIKPDINEQYLTIAHRTGGSLHTLKSDIWNLSDKKEGEVVTIGQSRYVLRNRQFIKLL